MNYCLISHHVLQTVCIHLTRMKSLVHHRRSATSISLGDAFKRENTFFDLDHGIKVTLNIAQQLLYHVSFSPAKF